MKSLVLLVFFFSIMLPVIPINAATAASPTYPLISEVQVAGIIIDESEEKAVAGLEFIELYNPTDQKIALNGWELQYLSKNGDNTSGWITKVELSGALQPRGHYLLSAEDYLIDVNQTFKPGLANTAGHIRLVVPSDDQFIQSLPITPLPDDVVVDNAELVDQAAAVEPEWYELDRVAWGEASYPEANSASVPKAGESLSRSFSPAGKIIDTDDNQADFSILTTPTPTLTLPVALPDEPEIVPPEPSDDPLVDDLLPDPPIDSPEDPVLPPVYQKLIITEILPDPVAPARDAEAEFVELYNPNDQPVNLANYTIQTGANLQYDARIGSQIINPKSYATFYSKTSNITLPNGGGRVQLLDPNGDVAAVMISYQSAKPGNSWAQFGAAYAWSNRPTPNLANRKSITPTPVKPPKPQPTISTVSKLRQSYPQLVITELLPDPAAPQSDKDDEFVEIYNPNTFTVELTGYSLATGKNFQRKHQLSGSIKPKSYLVIFSNTASISLANSGGSARLIGENGQVIFTAKAYTKAKPGLAWINQNGNWAWSQTPTPAAANQLNSPQSSASLASTVKSATTMQSQRSAALAAITAPAVIPTSPLSTTALAIAAALAMLYAGYEFRHDVGNRLELIRRYFARSGRE